ncbi:2'-5' RNA ligase [Rhizobium sp. BK176]|nr:hypothetical protein [Rhizobium sp. BK661]MCS3738391.1 2'-5' RNA ligase [Rhizobium sp. BK661]MCS4091511.1 2'-5' RNA ligase [Rhizobium sp. BK176]
MRGDPAVAAAGTPSPRIATSASRRPCFALLCRQERARIPEGVIAAERQAGPAIDACQFELAFDHIITVLLPQDNAIVLAGNGGRELLRQLRVQIAIEMHRLGADANLNPNFQPHATLLYDKDMVPRSPCRSQS